MTLTFGLENLLTNYNSHDEYLWQSTESCEIGVNERTTDQPYEQPDGIPENIMPATCIVGGGIKHTINIPYVYEYRGIGYTAK